MSTAKSINEAFAARPEKYILNGHEPVPIDDLMLWGKWMGTGDQRRVAHDQPFPNVRVSTVFLGLDHRFGSHGPPILFETMVFGGEFNNLQERYCTWDEAEKGHAEILQRVLTAKEH